MRPRGLALCAGFAWLAARGELPPTDPAVAPPTSTSTGAGGGATSTAPATTSPSAGGGGAGGQPGVGGAPACPPEPFPGSVPAGWVEFADWSCNCRFYVPGDAASLPPPIAWEPCPKGALGDAHCEAMVLDWTQGNGAIAASDMMRTNPDGTAVLAFRRITEDGPHPHDVDLVADADGPVRSAILQSIERWKDWSDPGCFLYSDYNRTNDGRVVYTVYGDDVEGAQSQSNAWGAIGGAWDDLRPRVLARRDDAWFNDHFVEGPFECTSWGFSFCPLGGSSRIVTTWDLAATTTYEPCMDGDPAVMSGDWILASSYGTVHSWSAAAGARTLLEPTLPPATEGFGNLGTDGKVMVWSHGLGPMPDELSYPDGFIEMAPFTLDPAALAPVKVRAQPVTSINTLLGWVVGCGYAALDGTVVRLSDGVAWTLEGNIDLGFDLYDFIGITCEHVYVDVATFAGGVNTSVNIARIRLDSLGPGTPSGAAAGRAGARRAPPRRPAGRARRPGR
jgi:hypothetical protein